MNGDVVGGRSRPVIVIPDDINVAYRDSAELDQLRAIAEVVVHGSRPQNEQDLIERTRGANTILSFRPAFTKFPASVIRAAPSLRFICISGTGVEDIDISEATAHGIAVANVVGSANRAVGELCIALMFAVARGIARQDRSVRLGEWKSWQGLELGGKTLGVVGLSGIGTELAAMARGLGMRVISWSRNNDPERAEKAGAIAVSIDELLSQADVISLHLRLNEETRNFLDSDRLARLKSGAIVINTARGGLISEAALIGALRSGKLTGAGLDVFALEPLPADNPLRTMDNVVMTPVSGWNTLDSSRRMISQSIDNVVMFHANNPKNVVNAAALKL